MKVLGASIVAATLLFLAAVNVSFVDTPFVCAGAISNEQGWRPATAAFTLRQYHRWAEPWSGSHGHAWIRLPGDQDYSFAHVDERGSQLRIAGCGTEVRGLFSTASGELTLHTRKGDFRGSCLEGHFEDDCTETCVRGPQDL